ncbi:hypothetical protein P3X46_033937 [Hevea brasiliensis]|uniref:Calmodulin-binding domain-containing protein n=1 Tax=Hevea brasiliensis TaxID=3981 RepID=A0ABQ9KAZ8_HEVBR|nr:uncharacterized protein LOC110655316 [Hevea brasiliensis]KAJ9129266.1 hypothetical protein P3X46_033937 [Hevea brasiliensis]
MDTDRPHRSNSNNNSSSTSSTSELFICFTSRLPSSSMKISSKSILSPGRAREPSQISLSNSLSRRLRTNGSMKGGQASPMFPTNGKKRGCAFENPEPSSPKVTCIGQVRVKTKKQGKKLRTRSQRRGEVSFRRVDQTSTSNSSNIEASNHQDFTHNHANNQFLNQQQQQECLPHRNQRWVHLPLTICEALRAFGAEFNCFLPCRSSCMASEKEKEDKAAGSSNSSSCGAVFARWLVAVQEGDEKGREIELVVGEDEEEDREDSTERRRSYRRHVFEEIEFKEEKYGEGNESMQEEEARVSICIPPKNALLLMRCRSDPVRMAALANKFWEAPLPNDEDEEAGEDDGKEEEEKENVEVEAGHDEERQRTQLEQEMKHGGDLINESCVSCEAVEEHQIQETEASLVNLEGEDGEDCQESSTEIRCVKEGNLEEQEEKTEIQVNQQQETLLDDSSPSREETEDPEYLKDDENEEELLQDSRDNLERRLSRAEDDEQERNFSDDNVSVHQKESEEAGQDLVEDQESKSAETARALAEEFARQETHEQRDSTCMQEEEEEEEEEDTVAHERSKSVDPTGQEGQSDLKSKESESQPVLPECLLLMMCEPKLSMEVSKETWVCSTDFIRWLPEHSRPVKKKEGGDEAKKKRNSIDINPPPVHNNWQQPPRSSCSYPAKPPARAAGAESMSTVIEQKLVGTKGIEPFVLTRCKSEPMRSAAKLAPEACFWKNRKLEPHRPATLGVGKAGVGF